MLGLGAFGDTGGSSARTKGEVNNAEKQKTLIENFHKCFLFLVMAVMLESLAL